MADKEQSVESLRKKVAELRLLFETHRELMSLQPENLTKFKSVVEMTEAELREAEAQLKARIDDNN